MTQQVDVLTPRKFRFDSSQRCNHDHHDPNPAPRTHLPKLNFRQSKRGDVLLCKDRASQTSQEGDGCQMKGLPWLKWSAVSLSSFSFWWRTLIQIADVSTCWVSLLKGPYGLCLCTRRARRGRTGCGGLCKRKGWCMTERLWPNDCDWLKMKRAIIVQKIVEMFPVSEILDKSAFTVC